METLERLRAEAWPISTISLCGVATVVFFVPALQSLLIYDRVAILDGEWWRLVTGNLVHFSTTHFVYDVFALLVSGTLIELKRYPRFFALCSTAGLGIGAALLLFDPGLHYYGGLSGIGTAAVVYLCLCGLRETGFWRWLCAIVILLVVIKTGFEFLYGETLVDFAAAQPFVPTPLSHVMGTVISVMFFVLTLIKKN